MKRLLLPLFLLPLFAFAQSPNDTLREDTLVAPPLTIEQRLTALLSDELLQRSQLGLYVFDLEADTVVFAHNARQTMRPASCQKLVTAIAALDRLGTDYRFKTEIFASKLNEKGRADAEYKGEITIRGGYDPLVGKDDLEAFSNELKARGVKRLSCPVRFDLSFKDADRLGWGWCWDDKAVPLTPLLYQNKDCFAEELRKAFSRSDVKWNCRTKEGLVRDRDNLILVRTHTIDEVLFPMMKDSENSMAEAMFYQLAAAGGKRYATRKDAARLVNSLITDLGLNPAHYQIADGSGLSLYNYVTPELLGRLLRHAYRRKDIYDHLLSALPVAAQDGTLRRRMVGTPAAGNVTAKTGTLEGVASLAGYLTTADRRRFAFVIINQGLRRLAEGRAFQDRVCQALTE